MNNISPLFYLFDANNNQIVEKQEVLEMPYDVPAEITQKLEDHFASNPNIKSLDQALFDEILDLSEEEQTDIDLQILEDVNHKLVKEMKLMEEQSAQLDVEIEAERKVQEQKRKEEDKILAQINQDRTSFLVADFDLLDMRQISYATRIQPNGEPITINRDTVVLSPIKTWKKGDKATIKIQGGHNVHVIVPEGEGEITIQYIDQFDEDENPILREYDTALSIWKRGQQSDGTDGELDVILEYDVNNARGYGLNLVLDPAVHIRLNGNEFIDGEIIDVDRIPTQGAVHAAPIGNVDSIRVVGILNNGRGFSTFRDRRGQLNALAITRLEPGGLPMAFVGIVPHKLHLPLIIK